MKYLALYFTIIGLIGIGFSASMFREVARSEWLDTQTKGLMIAIFITSALLLTLGWWANGP